MGGEFVTDAENDQASFFTETVSERQGYHEPLNANQFSSAQSIKSAAEASASARQASVREENDRAAQSSAVELEPGWLAQLSAEFQKPYMRSLSEFLRQQKRAGKEIYPRGSQMFAALNATPFDRTRVVILGQDPYHGPGQAHGLSFSVQPNVALPPSLRNIFKELANDVGVQNGAHGCLTPWAQQGVLLLNSVLSVVRGQAASHQGKGWEGFTDEVIQRINQGREGVVFMLWGSYAQKKGRVIDQQRHLVLKSPHPSPLSAHRGFFGCGHFSKANAYLVSRGQDPINWQLPDIV